jgi:1-acyl-sn-glycerol-3-phosphate acyltransferase
MFTQLSLFIRTLIFYTGYLITLIPFTTACVVIGCFFPIKSRFQYFVLWNNFAIWWLKISCNVHVNITGLNNVPSGSFILVSNHQSPWETIFLYDFFQPLTATLKKELLLIPFFGWALAMLNPIAIDRSKIRSARNMLLKEGQKRLDDGISVLIFPEGTRVDPGQDKAWSTGAATLAIEAEATLLPVAHNAGLYWPAHKFIKFPGTVEVVIGEPINASGQSPRELTEQVKQWVKQAVPPSNDS